MRFTRGSWTTPRRSLCISSRHSTWIVKVPCEECSSFFSSVRPPEVSAGDPEKPAPRGEACFEWYSMAVDGCLCADQLAQEGAEPWEHDWELWRKKRSKDMAQPWDVGALRERGGVVDGGDGTRVPGPGPCRTVALWLEAAVIGARKPLACLCRYALCAGSNQRRHAVPAASPPSLEGVGLTTVRNNRERHAHGPSPPPETLGTGVWSLGGTRRMQFWQGLRKFPSPFAIDTEQRSLAPPRMPATASGFVLC